MLTLVTEIAMGAMDPARAGSASAVLETAGEFGGALGIAVLGSIGAAVYRSRILLPDALSSADAALARQTLAGATVVAGRLPGTAGPALLIEARAAFTAGIHGVAIVGATVLVLAAAGCLAGLRHAAVPASDGSEQPV